MGFVHWLIKPIIVEVAVKAMNKFMKEHWTRFLTGVVVLFVGVAWLLGKPGVTVQTFLEAAVIGVGGNALRSSVHAIAGAVTKNNHQENKT